MTPTPAPQTSITSNRKAARPPAGSNRFEHQPEVVLPQYSVGRVLATWAAAALPMAALAWIGAPLLAARLEGASAWPRAIVLCLTVGLGWQFVFVLATVRREQGSLRWTVVRDALWLRGPRNPHTGRRGGRLWLVLVPLVLAVAAKESLPKIAAPIDRDQGLFLQSAAGRDFFAGNWTWFVVMVAMMVFNTVLGEELLFRGLLLPRMRGAFGRRDWLANGILFGLYHLHLPWSIPANLLDTFIVSYPCSRYRSALIGICVHSVQTVVFTSLLLVLVLR
jgi:membrane protease YdiL (CAAX protease family)